MVQSRCSSNILACLVSIIRELGDLPHYFQIILGLEDGLPCNPFGAIVYGCFCHRSAQIIFYHYEKDPYREMQLFCLPFT